MAAAKQSPSIPQPRDRRDFEVALICALKVEFDAVEALFDLYWDEGDYGKAEGDPNAYSTGRIGSHNVVLAFMPGMGKSQSASLAASFRGSFPGIRLGLVVGICGGIPFYSEDEEIILGDVILSTGLIQFDFGRQFSDRHVRKDTLLDNLGRPNVEIRSLLAKLSGMRSKTQLEANILANLTQLLQKRGFERSKYPGVEQDKLYRSTLRHKHHAPADCTLCKKCVGPTDSPCDDALELSCQELGCPDGELVSRTRLRPLSSEDQLKDAIQPVVHFGLIASGDEVIKSAQHRDKVSQKEKVLAFEMEGAGVWDNFPTVVVKGVADYADSHKNKMWQRYAAATAASCMKAFLLEWKGLPRQQTQAGAQEQGQLSTLMAQLLSSQPQKPDESQQDFISAVEAGDVEAVKDKIKAGQSVSFQSTVGTPLGLAITAGKIAVVQVLLEAGADPEIRHKLKFKPLQMAAEANSPELVLMLLRHGAKLSQAGIRAQDLVVYAVMKDSDELLKHALTYKPDVNLPDRKGKNALCQAIGRGNATAVSQLLEAGANPMKNDLQGNFPLLMAMHSTRDNHVIAEQLLKSGDGSLAARLLSLADHQGTSMAAAIRSQPPESVAVLLRYGAAAEAELAKRHFLEAIQVGRTDIIKVFLDFDPKVASHTVFFEGKRLKPIHIVAKMGRVDIGKLLQSYGADLQSVVESPNDMAGLNVLGMAVTSCQAEFVTWLVDIGFDVNAPCGRGHLRKRQPAIFELTKTAASIEERKIMLECLLKHGADIDFHNPFLESVLCQASAGGDIELMKLLIANSASLEALNLKPPPVPQSELQFAVSVGRAPLHYAAAICNSDAIELLILSGANLGAVDYYGGTAVHHVATSASSDLAKVAAIAQLHCFGAKLDVETTVAYTIVTGDANGVKGIVPGSTPAHLAAGNYFALDTIKYLANNSSTVNTQDENGHAPLHIAVTRPPRALIGKAASQLPSDQLAVIQALLDRGANVDLPNQKGETALCIAVRNSNLAATILLLDSGADIEAPSSRSSPLLLSSSLHDTRISTTLLDRGATITSTSSRSIFQNACRQRNTALVDTLLAHGLSHGDPDTGFYPLHLAAAVSDNGAVIGVLLKHGVPVDARGANGQTALHVAAACELSAQNVGALVDAGADKTVKDDRGATPGDVFRAKKERFEKQEYTGMGWYG